MRIQLAATIRKYDKKNFSKDILAGIIIMAVSIPIAMGYAQIAGLPAPVCQAHDKKFITFFAVFRAAS